MKEQKNAYAPPIGDDQDSTPGNTRGEFKWYDLLAYVGFTGVFQQALDVLVGLQLESIGAGEIKTSVSARDCVPWYVLPIYFWLFLTIYTTFRETRWISIVLSTAYTGLSVLVVWYFWILELTYI